MVQDPTAPSGDHVLAQLDEDDTDNRFPVAVADAPPTIDGALQAAYDSAAIYFPFTDVIVADPYKDIADGLKVAFYIGQSNIVGGTTTDMVAYVTGDVFVQIWIGAEDKLPRRVYAVYLTDRARLGYVIDFIVVHAGSWHWPTFNIADASISVGALLLAYDLIFERKKVVSS